MVSWDWKCFIPIKGHRTLLSAFSKKIFYAETIMAFVWQPNYVKQSDISHKSRELGIPLNRLVF